MFERRFWGSELNVNLNGWRTKICKCGRRNRVLLSQVVFVNTRPNKISFANDASASFFTLKVTFTNRAALNFNLDGSIAQLDFLLLENRTVTSKHASR